MLNKSPSIPPPSDRPQRQPHRARHANPPPRRAIRWLHEGHKADEAFVSSYPAHLHIDILPAGQGAGWGRKLMHTFWDKLRSFDVPSVHLGVSKDNPRAVGFYQHLGFHKVREADWGIVFGFRLYLGNVKSNPPRPHRPKGTVLGLVF